MEAAIEWQLKEFQERTKINCIFQNKLKTLELSPEIATRIFRIFQETLTNIARHSKASKVNTLLTQNNGNLVLRVIDNGVGIEEGKVENKKSLGLLGIRERATILGGELNIQGQKGKGTKIELKVPYNVK
ncbi:MAG: hypothetical protein GTO02_22670 [Candidatus Dadabacteria bacterium]|nr:hypothetical protein [Candidatus Dadabacteria bacterium]NIQ17082.1 hypothetical protein [Candidatus Dadabacteria bacterium]